MSDAVDLMRSLETIREAATRVLHASGSESHEAFCVVIHRQLPTVAEEFNLATNDLLRLKVLHN